MPMSPESKALIAAARRSPARPPADSRERMRAKVMGAVGLGAGASALGAAGTAGATGAAATTATAAATTGATVVAAAKVGLLGKLLAVVVVGGAVTGGVLLATRAAAPEPAPSASAVVSPPRTPSSAEIAAQIARDAVTLTKPERHRFETPAPASESAKLAASVAAPPTASSASASAPLASAAARPAQAAASAPDEDPLKAETKLLASAQEALSAGDAASVLRITGEHARLFPKGSLAGERRALRALALCAQGHKEQGRSEGAAVPKTSPLGERIEAACR